MEPWAEILALGTSIGAELELLAVDPETYGGATAHHTTKNNIECYGTASQALGAAIVPALDTLFWVWQPWPWQLELLNQPSLGCFWHGATWCGWLAHCFGWGGCGLLGFLGCCHLPMWLLLLIHGQCGAVMLALALVAATLAFLHGGSHHLYLVVCLMEKVLALALVAATLAFLHGGSHHLYLVVCLMEKVAWRLVFLLLAQDLCLVAKSLEVRLVLVVCLLVKGWGVGVPASGTGFVPGGKVSGSEAGVGGVFAGKGLGRVPSVGEGGLGGMAGWLEGLDGSVGLPTAWLAKSLHVHVAWLQAKFNAPPPAGLVSKYPWGRLPTAHELRLIDERRLNSKGMKRILGQIHTDDGLQIQRWKVSTYLTSNGFCGSFAANKCVDGSGRPDSRDCAAS
eukprot:s642_g2.t1